MLSDDSGTKSRTLLISGVAVVLAIAALAGATLVASSQGGSRIWLGDLGPGTATASSAHSLNLSVSLNSTFVAVSHAIGITIEEQNTLPEANNVTREMNWPLIGLSLGGCGTLNYPFGIAVFSGFYTKKNVSAAQALDLSAPGAYNCPAIFAIGSYYFEPFIGSKPSTSGTDAYFEPSNLGPQPMSSTIDSTGYYAQAAFRPYPRGVYTVAAGDEWGALVIVHFAVLNNDEIGGGARLDVELTARGNGSFPIPNEPVTVTPSSTTLTLPLSFGIITNSTGMAERAGVPPGRYSVSFVYDNQIYRFNVTLSTSGSTLLVVYLPGGGFRERVCGGGGCEVTEGVYRIRYGACPQQNPIPLFGKSSNGTRPGELVIIMRENTTATVCVRYSLPASATGPRTLALKPWAGVGQVTQGAGYYSFQTSPINSTVVHPNATTITLSPGGNITVVFTITTTSPKGYYYLIVPYLCPDVPLSIGYDPPYVKSSDFPGAGPIPCPAFEAQAVLTGVGGADVFYMSY